MNWEHFRAVLWLRWRVRINQLRRGGIANVIILGLLGALVLLFAMAGFGGSLAGGFALAKASPIVVLLVWDGLVALFLFLWAVGLLAELQRTEALALTKFLHLPISPFGIFIVNYLSSLFSVNLFLFARAVVTNGVLDDRDIGLVTEEKRQVIRASEALEFYPVTETVDDVGGLNVLKDWLRLRERAFTQEARNYGLPPPKGIALIGIPGTGKSLTAKMIGGLWRLPLLRLDVGALFGSYMGQSEEQARRALQVAGSVAPCILWLDEMEKALAHGGQDSGTSTRVFGSILTWMQEKTVPVFVVATANDISSLPPELLRKGRFDEIFFLDLPNLVERKEILDVHIRKRHRVPQDFDVDRLARETEGYVGSEIEQSVIDAMYIGFNESREFNTEDLLAALKKTVPLSISQKEQVDFLREWLDSGRAQSASSLSAEELASKARE